MAERWHVNGDFIDFCKCSAPCPCSWGQAPTTGDCDGIIVWRVREGSYGDVKLDGLNVAALGQFEGNIWEDETKMRAGFILDERADDSQREALQAIFGGQAGGWPEMFASTAVGELLGMEVAPIDVKVSGDADSWSVNISGIGQGNADVMTGPTSAEGKPVRVQNIPAAEPGPNSGPTTYGIAQDARAEGFGFNFDVTGRSSKHIPFEWTSDDQF